MADTIVYTTVSKGGGVDGMDASDKGGEITGAYLLKESASRTSITAYNTVNPIVVDLNAIAEKTLNELDPVTRLAIIYYFENRGYSVR